MVMRPLALSAVTARRSGVTLEEGVVRLGVQRSGRFVENQKQRLIAHEATRQGELLPLAER